MSKLTLEDTTRSALMKLSEGNPGALTVMIQALKDAPEIDPDSVGGGAMVLLQLDDLDITGPRIWMLFKDVCDENLSRMLGALRAVQLGIVSRETLHAAIDNRGQGLDLNAALAGVKKQLPDFQVELPDAAQA